MQTLVPGFSIVSTLNQGDSATVYLALDQPSGRELALKVMPLTGQPEDISLASVRQRLQAFSHPNIVKIFDLGLSSGEDSAEKYVYLTMQYLPGSHLNHKRFELNFLERLRVVTDIAHGLEYIGAQGYVHGALTPDNVVVHEPDGRAMLVGFGLSQRFTAPVSNSRVSECPGPTQENSASIDAPLAAHFFSPEQWEEKPLDPRSDLYSLGVILFLLLADYLPFAGATLEELSAQSSSANIPQLPEHLLAFQPIINKLLTRDIEARFSTAAECLEQLGCLPESAIHQAVAGFEYILLQQGEQAHSPFVALTDFPAREPIANAEILAYRDDILADDYEQFTSSWHPEIQTDLAGASEDITATSIHAERFLETDNSSIKSSRFSKMKIVLAMAFVAIATIYYLSHYLSAVQTDAFESNAAKLSAPPLIPERKKREILQFPAAPGLEEQARVLRKQLDQDLNFATDLVVIYRAGLRGEDSGEKMFARRGLNELQEIFSQRIQSQLAARKLDTAQKTRAMAQQLFETDELLPELKYAFAAAEGLAKNQGASKN
jgi:serine/threonine protein kinase